MRHIIGLSSNDEYYLLVRWWDERERCELTALDSGYHIVVETYRYKRENTIEEIVHDYIGVLTPMLNIEEEFKEMNDIDLNIIIFSLNKAEDKLMIPEDLIMNGVMDLQVPYQDETTHQPSLRDATEGKTEGLFVWLKNYIFIRKEAVGDTFKWRVYFYDEESNFKYMETFEIFLRMDEVVFLAMGNLETQGAIEFIDLKGFKTSAFPHKTSLEVLLGCMETNNITLNKVKVIVYAILGIVVVSLLEVFIILGNMMIK